MKNRFNEYRVMWLIVFFDLPVMTKKERREATDFRKQLMSDGFLMYQYSVYVRPCGSSENADAHTRRIHSFMPSKGKVSIMRVTDKQFGAIGVFYGGKAERYENSEDANDNLLMF